MNSGLYATSKVCTGLVTLCTLATTEVSPCTAQPANSVLQAKSLQQKIHVSHCFFARLSTDNPSLKALLDLSNKPVFVLPHFHKCKTLFVVDILKLIEFEALRFIRIRGRLFHFSDVLLEVDIKRIERLTENVIVVIGEPIKMHLHHVGQR